jgi:hypothetical protein
MVEKNNVIDLFGIFCKGIYYDITHHRKRIPQEEAVLKMKALDGELFGELCYKLPDVICIEVVKALLNIKS